MSIVKSINGNPIKVDATGIDDGAISTAKIADGAVTSAKLASGAIASTSLADGAISTTKLADEAVTTGKLGDGAVTSVKIASDAITADKLDDSVMGIIASSSLAWEQGSISTSGVDQTSSISIRTIGRKSYPEGTNLKMWCDDGYKFAYVMYSDDRNVHKSAYWFGNGSGELYGPVGITFTEDLELRFVIRKIDETAITPEDGDVLHMIAYPSSRLDVVHGNWRTGLIDKYGNISVNEYLYGMCTSWYYRFSGDDITIRVADGYGWRMFTYEDDAARTFVSRTDIAYDGVYTMPTEAGKMYRFNCYRTSETGRMTPEEADIAFIVQSMTLEYEESPSLLDSYDERLFLQLRHLKGSTSPKCTSLIHFSDIHGDEDALVRIMQYATEAYSDVDDVLCTGDLVNNDWGSDFGFWQTAGATNVLTVMGNHDEIHTRTNWGVLTNYKTMAECYSRYMENYIIDWGVTYQANKTYWYKDYNDSVRLIALDLVQDGLSHDDVQMAWFNNVLSSARADGLAVVVAQHFPLANGESWPNVNGWFDTEYDAGFYDRSYWNPRAAWHDAIETYKAAGGEFICWLSGHTHADLASRNASYPTQLCITIDTATPTKSAPYSDTNRTVGTPTEDLFNVIAFDTVNKTVRVMRVGASENMFMQTKKALCINYATGETLSAI